MCVTFLFVSFLLLECFFKVFGRCWDQTVHFWCINIVRHGTLLYITPGHIPYCTEHDASVQRLNGHMDALPTNAALGSTDLLSEDNSAPLDRLNTLINVLKPKYYHTDE